MQIFVTYFNMLPQIYTKFATITHILSSKNKLMTHPKMETLNIHIKTYGCQANEYDSAKMLDVISEQSQMPVQAVESPENAHIILLNTCSVREKAQEKSSSDLGRYRLLKEKNKNVLIGIGGCVASQEGEALIKRFPFVDLVFGPQTLHRLPGLIAERKTSGKAAIDVSFPEIEKFDHLPEPRAEGPTAFVSIMEGCSKYCTFCIVPFTRGEEFSRSFDSVIAEVASLVEQGVKEIHLLGQNVNNYQGIMHNGEVADLALLIHYIAAFDEVKRIRFTTSHPAVFNDRLIEAFAEEPKLANHLHLPVQSGSDRILAAMKRGYTSLEYKSKLRKLRRVRPDISISSDFIVGFPGETEKDFEATMNLIQDIGFDTSFSFIYSERPGTPAAGLPDDVPLEEKKNRLSILQTRIHQNAARISQAMIGSIQPVLVTGKAKKNAAQLSGRTENNRVVNFIADDTALIGQVVNVKIMEALPNSLRGALIDNQP